MNGEFKHIGGRRRRKYLDAFCPFSPNLHTMLLCDAKSKVGNLSQTCNLQIIAVLREFNFYIPMETNIVLLKQDFFISVVRLV